MTNEPKVGRKLKIGMYLLSLWLLFLLIIVNKINIELCFTCSLASRSEVWIIVKQNYLPVLCLSLLAISSGFYFRFKYLIDGARLGPKKILEVQDKGAEHLVFLATYVIPLVGFGLDNVRQVINLAITLIILGAIYIKTNLFYANPTLSLLGFKIFSAKIDGKDVILISRERLESDDTINFLPLDRSIYFVKKAMRI